MATIAASLSRMLGDFSETILPVVCPAKIGNDWRACLSRESGARIGGSSVMRLALRRAAGLGPATLVLLFACDVPLPAWAASGPVDTGGTAWVLVASALVLFMTLPGLALFYGG